MSGLGRGGRGQALASQSTTPLRRPDEPAPGASQPPPVQAGVASIGLGRGSGLGRAKLFPQAPVAPQEAPAPTGLGRGRSLMGASAKVASVSTASVSQATAASASTGSPAVAGSDVADLSRGLQRLELPKEPVTCRGSEGKPLTMYTNHIRLAFLPGQDGVHEYQVLFEPMLENRNIRYRLVKQLCSEQLNGVPYIFSGTNMCLPVRLPQQETRYSGLQSREGTEYLLTVKWIKKKPMEECRSILNILFKRIQSVLQMIQVGRCCYDPNNKIRLNQHKLEVWPGHITAIELHEGGLLLVCDIAHRVLRTDTVYDFMRECIARCKGGWQAEFTKQLVGTSVMTSYNKKNYRVDDIYFEGKPTDSFTNSKGQEMTFVDYYKSQYPELTISDLQQPLLISRPKRRELRRTAGGGLAPEAEEQTICLIPEFCVHTGLTDQARADFRIMKDLGEHTRVVPNVRMNRLQTFLTTIKTNPECSKILQGWNIRIADSVEALDGRVLPQETIHFQNGNTADAGPEADWGRAITRHKMSTPVNLNNWVIIFQSRNRREADAFCSNYMNWAPRLGVRVANPNRVELPDDKIPTVMKAMTDTNQDAQIHVVIMGVSRDDKYAAIKKHAYLTLGKPNQVIVSRTLSNDKKVNSVVMKVALQINCKLGGDLWYLHIPMKKVMFVGIDSYHEKGKNALSCGALVASTNERATNWYSGVRMQRHGQELMDVLKTIMIKAVTEYQRCQNQLPNRIIIFRDGVGDGQLNVVRDYEVGQIKESLATFGNWQPTITVIVVQKRINTRLMSKVGPSDAANPPPGSIMDHTITRYQWPDFFLVSQHVRQGTVSPTHYVVVHDDSGLKPDHLQRVSYKMTHLYYNWPGTVRVPAPCQYAHKLAYLAGQHLRDEPNERMLRSLFYL